MVLLYIYDLYSTFMVHDNKMPQRTVLVTELGDQVSPPSVGRNLSDPGVHLCGRRESTLRGASGAGMWSKVNNFKCRIHFCSQKWHSHRLTGVSAAPAPVKLLFFTCDISNIGLLGQGIRFRGPDHNFQNPVLIGLAKTWEVDPSGSYGDPMIWFPWCW